MRPRLEGRAAVDAAQEIGMPLSATVDGRTVHGINPANIAPHGLGDVWLEIECVGAGTAVGQAMVDLAVHLNLEDTKSILRDNPADDVAFTREYSKRHQTRLQVAALAAGVLDVIDQVTAVALPAAAKERRR